MRVIVLLLSVVFLLLGCEDLLEEPIAMVIERVTVEKMPFANSSNIDWDELSGPDVFIRFEETSVTGGIETGTNQDISPTELPVTWILSPTFTLGDFSNNLVIYLYDEDVLADDFIAGAEFEIDPVDEPDTWTLTFNENLAITIDVSYEF